MHPDADPLTELEKAVILHALPAPSHPSRARGARKGAALRGIDTFTGRLTVEMLDAVFRRARGILGEAAGDAY